MQNAKREMEALIYKIEENEAKQADWRRQLLWKFTTNQKRERIDEVLDALERLRQKLLHRLRQLEDCEHTEREDGQCLNCGRNMW